MNNYIPSGTSLFDVLSMIIPGGLIIALVADVFGFTIDDQLLTKYSIFYYTAIIIAGYLVGLIWDSLMSCVFEKCRNNEYLIYYAKKSLDKPYIKTKSGCLKLCFKLICFFYKNIFLCRRSKLNPQRNHPNIMELYLQSYYEVAKTPIRNVIVILETQVSFIRNMLLIILAYSLDILFINHVIAKMFENNLQIFIGWLLLIIFIFLFCVMRNRLIKIHSLIWEGAYYNQKNKCI